MVGMTVILNGGRGACATLYAVVFPCVCACDCFLALSPCSSIIWVSLAALYRSSEKAQK